MQTVVDAALKLRLDGTRLFIFPRRTVREQDGEYYHVSPASSQLGVLDIQGGWAKSIVTVRPERQVLEYLDDYADTRRPGSAAKSAPACALTNGTPDTRTSRSFAVRERIDVPA